MKLKEALGILHNPESRTGRTPFVGFLVCGFEPLHLKTLLAAQLQNRLPEREVSIQTGLYGDLVGNLNRMQDAEVDAAAVVLEWSDLDPRLGIRHLGGWRPADLQDILKTVNARVFCVEEAVFEAADRTRLALCLPSLPLPPISFVAAHQSSGFDVSLRETLSQFAASVACKTNIRLVNPQWLDTCSPLQNRRDVKSELIFGFPYLLQHASAIAEALAKLMCPPPPKKGLITDLDETLWSGILGEVGVQGISWNLSKLSQLHGLYQQLLVSLSDAGVLIAAASKNDADLVEEVFQREDIVLPGERIYPIEAHWGSKSESVGRILQIWNIAADSVVFVDDSLIELAEVRATYPDIECIHFPHKDSQAIYELLGRLRNSFGKEVLTEEDGLRRDSIRSAKSSHEYLAAGPGRLDEFLKEIDAEVTISLVKDLIDARALELINKTNQFNLNGRRYTESSWKAYLQAPDTFLLSLSYRDKFGPIGKIALMTGRFLATNKLQIQAWVLSCRAFSRRIEHQCLAFLFGKFLVDKIVFEYEKTPRNGPTQELFKELFDGSVESTCELSREHFLKKCPMLFHKVKEVSA